MSGECDLGKLLAGMDPVLHDEEYVFCTVREPVLTVLLHGCIGVFREKEGTTLILSRKNAEAAGLSCTYPCRRITLSVHSSLEAIGFLARVTALLAAHGISTNVVSAFFHDHIFVPLPRAEEALAILREASCPVPAAAEKRSAIENADDGFPA